jgi:NDP-sugar pyrophosphorylase family protein
MQVVILAGGLGTRLGEQGAQRPKALMPVSGRPFLAHVIELLRGQGLSRLLLLVGHHGDQIEKAVGDGSALGVQLRYCFDGPRLLGTGGALRAALPKLEDEFLVLYGDTFLDIDYQAVISAFRTSRMPALMTVLHNQGRWDTSNVEFRDGKLIRYSKRDRTPAMQYIDYGLAALRKEAIAELPESQRADLADLYSRLVAEGRMAGFEVFERFYEIGTPEALAETERYLAKRPSRSGAR